MEDGGYPTCGCRGCCARRGGIHGDWEREGERRVRLESMAGRAGLELESDVGQVPRSDGRRSETASVC